jgi:capsular exopolysaccharide synthesis family protein
MSQNKKKKSVLPQEENLFIQLVSRYIFYWPLFLILIIIFATGAFVFTRYATPKYQANATIIIKDEKKGSDDSKAMESLNMINTKKIIENEIEVLQSRTIMENVVKSLHLYAPIFQEGKIRDISAYTISPISIITEYPDSLIPAKKIRLEFNQSSGVIYLNKRKAGLVNEPIKTKYGVLKFVANKKYIPSQVNKPFFFNLELPKTIAQNLLRDLKVSSANKLSSIINLDFKDEIPQRSEDVLNQLIVMYDRAAVDEKNSLAKNTLDFVGDRLNVVSKNLDSIEKSVQRYKTGTGATNISSQGQLYLQNVSVNDQELAKLNMQLAVLDQVDNAVKLGNTNLGGMMPSTLGVSDPNLSKLLTDLNTKELEYDRLRKTVAENNPMALALKEQIEKIRPSIVDNLSSQRQNLEASRQNLTATNNQYNSMLSSIPQKEKEILEISRDQNVKSSIYSFLLQKREESELSYASTISDSRVINSAQASKYPVSPNKPFIFLGAFGVALMLGFLLITAKESFSRKVLYRKDLEQMTSVPVIGEVAFNDSKESIVIEAGKRNFIAEEFRKIRVSLHFLGINESKKKILISSSIPGEGKSFIAANLAISNSLTGKKVALIDIDLHNPGLGKTFGKSTEDPGLSDYLTGKKKPEDIIKKTADFENLYFVSSGTLHDSPSELLLNGKINEFIDYLESRFDLIIIDTAPSVLITDAFVLTNLCDATLYVVRHKYTPNMLIKRLDESMEINPLNNPAIIFNGVKKRGFFKNNYGYGYDYVYGGKYQNEKVKKNSKNKK